MTSRWPPDPSTANAASNADMFPSHSRIVAGNRQRLDRIISGWRVIGPKPAVTARIGDYIVRTARNRALPSATRS
jgi:hypothetical protein